MVALIRSAALTGYAALARDFGLAPEALAAIVGLPSEALANPDLRIPAGRVGRLLELSAGAAGAEDFGLRLAETRQPSNLGMLALVVREEPTLRRGIEALARYTPLHNEAMSLRMGPLGGGWLISPIFANRRGQPMRQSVELALGVIHRIFSLLFGAAWQPELVCLAHAPPRDLSAHRRLFGAALQFHASLNGFVCHGPALDQPRPSADPHISRNARRYLDARLAQSERPLAERVCELVLWLLPSGDCDVDAIAKSLGLNRRTLHRHLARKGTGFAILLDSVRRDVARQQVAEPGRPLEAVAETLGFGGQSVFARWFRLRFGCSATEWRARHQIAGDPAAGRQVG